MQGDGSAISGEQRCELKGMGFGVICSGLCILTIAIWVWPNIFYYDFVLITQDYGEGNGTASVVRGYGFCRDCV